MPKESNIINTPSVTPTCAIRTIVVEYLPGIFLAEVKKRFAIKKGNEIIVSFSFGEFKKASQLVLSFLLICTVSFCQVSGEPNARPEKLAQQPLEDTATSFGSTDIKKQDITFCNAKPAAYQIDAILKATEGKRVALVGNHSTLVANTHLVDSLLSLGVNLVKVFAPEHGFRGDADAGETVISGKDIKTGLPIISLYGKNKKPNEDQLQNVDLIIFDIQDVGVRYYTYISTMHYTLEAAADLGIEYLVLDRPNPNGFYVDGPILNMQYKSFVGMHPVPLVHGMTVGEYAKMIVGEGWLNTYKTPKLRVIKAENYHHAQLCDIQVRPSPNLPNLHSIYLYPSLGFFEGTIVSVGRGTDKPFQQIGHPDYKPQDFSFTPKPSFGAQNPLFNGKTCFGYKPELPENIKPGQSLLTFQHLVSMYQGTGKPERYFNSFLANLMGTKSIHDLILKGASDKEIKSTYEEALENWNNNIRKKYLLYPDFDTVLDLE
jgi:uncharacterized protein YbbC (DUF1343 family)